MQEYSRRPRDTLGQKQVTGFIDTATFWDLCDILHGAKKIVACNVRIILLFFQNVKS